MSDKLALVPRNVSDATVMAETFSKSSLVPDDFKGKPNNVFLAISYGMELGIGPAASLRAIAVIKGKPTLYADAMVGLVMASGLAEYFICIKSDDHEAVYETKRRGAPGPVRKTFSVKDKQTARLGGNHETFPKHMREARAKSWLARDVYPDILHGIYSAEEVETGTFDASYQDQPPAQDFSAPGAESQAEPETAEEKVVRLLAELERVNESPAEYQNGEWDRLKTEILAMSKEERKPLEQPYKIAKAARDAHIQDGQ